MLQWQEYLQLKKPWKVEQAKVSCLGSILKARSCRRCVEVCPQQAIVVHGRQVVKEETRCNDCGLCMRVCPEQTFTSAYMSEGIQGQMEERIRLGEDSVVFACQEDSSLPSDLTTFDGLVVWCLGALQAEQIIIWALGGMNQIYLNISDCAGCKIGGLPLLRHAVNHARGLLRGLGWQGEIHWGVPTETNNGEGRNFNRQEAVDRRAFLSSIKSEAGKGLFSFMERVTENLIKRELPDHLKREIGATQLVRTKGVLPYRGPFIEALKSRKIQALQGAGETSLWQGIRRQKECSKCRICAGFCWSGAIERQEIDGQVELHYDGAKCNNCGYCLLACPEGVLNKDERWNFRVKSLL